MSSCDAAFGMRGERHRRPEAAAGGPCGTRVPSRGRLAPEEGACMR